MPVCAVHAPCLLFTQRVWGTEPWGKLERSAEMAAGGRRRGGRRAPAVPLAEGVRRATSSTASPRSRSRPASRSRSRTCTRGGRRQRRGMEMYLPGWDPSDGALRQHHHRPLARRDRAVRPGRDGRPAGRPAAARPPHRRHRLGQGRAPGARAAARPAPAEFLRHLAPDRLRAARSWSRSTPARPPTAPSARPTCASRWSSRASTSSAASRDAGAPRPVMASASPAPPGSPPGLARHPRGDPRGGPDARSPRRVRRHVDPRGRRGRRRRRRRWCTTTSAPRTTCSSPP